MVPDDATLSQIEAADPTANTWLAANAGSGKTRVLTDRVARLLLSGVSPQNILCLTYTKAAASEMQNRLFKRLGAWAMKPDADLRAELDELGVGAVEDLGDARRLFAGAIETPGGLKIQTIHSFCASILRRFPLEAEVSPQFKEMDDRTAKILQTEIVEDMASGGDRALLTALAAFYSGDDFAALTREIVGKRMDFAKVVDADEVCGWFGLAPGFDEADLPHIAFDGSERALITQVGPILASQSPTMVTLAETLAALDFETPSAEDLARLYDAFLYKTDGAHLPEAKLKSVPTKKSQEALGDLLAPLQAFMSRVAAAREAEISLYSARKTLALHRFAHPFVLEYERRKQARGWLDFDDLILRAGRLLSAPGVAAWVLYRLDGGIDHILVDEAQDTSPAQWRVIESLAREFTAGESARTERGRTLFVVGDQKQSIYSFQGADPAEFTRMHRVFDSAFKEIGQGVLGLLLQYSFRSSRAILEMVDHTLKSADGLGAEITHRAFHHDRPGRVDLWPVIATEKSDEAKPWTDPLDTPAPQDDRVQLANGVADAIEEMLQNGALPDENGGTRRVRAGDVLVLVRRRSEIFHQIIRACKARGLPIAGADRLRIGGELAVKDLTAVLTFLATPEDDLSLAAALRSPLLGLDEDALYRLAHGRGGRYLWNLLRERAADHAAVVAMLTDLRDEADFLRPYDLIDRILTRHDGRRRLIARLGPEAEDGIDALLTQSLAYERLQVPSLTGFLDWLAAEEVEIKRQMDSASDQVRVMTVHGSKGLEAPIVILPDTAKKKGNKVDTLTRLGDGNMAWRSGGAMAPAALRDAREEEKTRAAEEDMRLLYVAMTRAESWLVVAGAGDVGNEGESWYSIVKAGMTAAGGVDCDFALGKGQRFQIGEWPTAELVDAETTGPGPLPALPAWIGQHAVVPPKPTPPLVPSDLGGDKIVTGVDGGMEREAALRFGRQLHRLLEFLPTYPRANWQALTRDLLAFGEDAATPEEAAMLYDEVARVLEASDLAEVFHSDALAEVEISAPVAIGGATRVHGIIDRLILRGDSVRAIDFKTNRVVPERPEEIPEGILRQMGAYEAALASIYPDRRIESAVLWTRTPKLMVLPQGMALRAFGRLDAEGRRS